MTFYGVSVGYGDPDAITLKAVKTIEKCPVIAVPKTDSGNSLALSIAEQAADISGKEIIYLDFPMIRDKKLLEESHIKTAESICRRLEKSDTAMLCLGDISVYSTFYHIAEKVSAAGFSVKCIPGVTSFSAAAALIGKPIASDNLPLTVIPWGAENFRGLLANKGVKVIMKCGRNVPELKRLLKEESLLDRTFAIENCGMPDEKVFHAENIPDSPTYFTLFLTL